MTSSRLVAAQDMRQASARALAPSYMEALEASMAVSSQIMVWYSKMLCSTPWVISGW